MESIVNQVDITTVRLAFPQECMEQVMKFRIIGNDLLLYIPKTANRKDIIDKYISKGFNVIEKEFKLHISAQNKEDFISVFGDIKYEDRSNGTKFICTVTLLTEEEYDKFIKIGQTKECKCRIRPYKQLFSEVKLKSAEDKRKQRLEKKRQKEPRVIGQKHQSKEYKKKKNEKKMKKKDIK